jgi:hypothetical protein
MLLATTTFLTDTLAVHHTKDQILAIYLYYFKFENVERRIKLSVFHFYIRHCEEDFLLELV